MPKKPGYIRIGIVSATGDTTAQSQTLAATVNLLEILDGKDFAPYDTVRLESRMPNFISAEAAKKECDFILFVKDVTKRSHKKFKFPRIPSHLFGNALGLVPGIPYWHAAAAGQKVMNASELLTAVSSRTKQKDKVSITYSLVAVDGGLIVIPETRQEKIASKDGEDVLESLSVKIGLEVLTKVAKQ